MILEPQTLQVHKGPLEPPTSPYSCGGMSFPVFNNTHNYSKMKPQTGGRKRSIRRSKPYANKRHKSRYRTRMRKKHSRKRKRRKRNTRRRRKRMTGGYANDTIFPQPLVNLGRGLLTNGANLLHNYKGTAVSPSPYPTDQPNLRPMQDVFFGEIPNLKDISAAAESAVPPI